MSDRNTILVLAVDLIGGNVNVNEDVLCVISTNRRNISVVLHTTEALMED